MISVKTIPLKNKMINKFYTSLIIALISFLPLNIKAEEFQIFNDAEIDGIIQELSKPFFDVSGVGSEQMNIILLNSPLINAGALGGKHMVIFTGLIDFAEDPTMLAGVIAHECAHLAGGHIVKRREYIHNKFRNYGIGALAGLAAAIVAQQPELAMGALAFSTDRIYKDVMSYSQMHERAADIAGAKYMRALGVPMNGIINFHEKMIHQHKVHLDGVSPYLLTHPISKVRIDYLKNFQKQSERETEQLINDDFKERYKLARSKLLALLVKNPNYFLLKEATNNAELYQQAISHLRLRQFDLAHNKIDALISKKPNYPYFLQMKGHIYYDQGNLSSAKKYYKQASEKGRHFTPLKLEYAAVLIDLAEYEEAIDILHGLLIADYDNPNIWYSLAIIYGKMEKKQHYYSCLAHFQKIIGNQNLVQKYIATVEDDIENNGVSDKIIEQWLKDLKGES